MKTPIIQARQDDLFALREFDGAFVGSVMETRHSFVDDNRIRHVIDSNADLWSFTFSRTDHAGIRKLASFFWNISRDEYTYTKEADISVGRFREIIEPHQKDLDPFHRELATALIDSVAACDAADPLRDHIHRLNL